MEKENMMQPVPGLPEASWIFEAQLIFSIVPAALGNLLKAIILPWGFKYPQS